MKTETRYGKCKCGGDLEPDEDRLICKVCGKPTFSKALRHKYLERNKTAILKDLEVLTRPQVLKKWGIPGSTMPGLLKRWGEHASAPPRSGRVPKPGTNGQLPSFPEFSNEWQPEVQLAWFNGYLELKK